jgi:riboflavin synthase
MFTGIIEETGKVGAVRKGQHSSQITVSAGRILSDIHTGDSINTNGVCLTVVTFNKTSFTVDVMPETMSRTNLGDLRAGSEVNLERALKLSDRLGGHLVSGHIDGTGKIASRWKDGNAEWFRITAGKEILKYIVEKGSVAIDGISLTVVEANEASFTVSVIPHTHQQTTISGKKAGELVNIECDMIAKYLEKLINNGRGTERISFDFLADKGFIE